MCFKIVDNDSGEIIRRSTIRSTNKPSTANLQVDPLEPPPSVDDNDDDDVLDDFISLADFATPFHPKNQSDPVNYIPESTKSKTWQDIKQVGEYPEDTQQRHFQPEQPKSTVKQH